MSTNPRTKPAIANCAGGTTNDQPLLSFGLSYLVSLIKEQYADKKKKRHNKIPKRLIGAQAVALARYAYSLIDSL